MTTRKEQVTLTADQIAAAQAAGRATAEIEIECWKDQHDGSMSRAGEWVNGNLTCDDRSLPEDVQTRWEDVADDAAREVWNAARE